jgi:hypothetical protein
MLPERRRIAAIKGFLDPLEGEVLYETALAAARRGPCLEVGSYCGKSTVYIGAACRDAGTVLFSIDHHRGSEEQQPGEDYCDPDLVDASGRVNTLAAFRSTLAAFSLEDTVVPLVCASALAARAWATPLAFVFIDGGHAFDTVWNDYNAWAGHVMNGGYFAMHDVFERAEDGGLAPFEVYEMAVSSKLFEEVNRVRSLRVLQRRHCGTPAPPRRYAY